MRLSRKQVNFHKVESRQSRPFLIHSFQPKIAGPLLLSLDLLSKRAGQTDKVKQCTNERNISHIKEVIKKLDIVKNKGG